MPDHRWAVDAIEGDIARVEEDGKRMLNVPVHLLPEGVDEGQVLRISRASGSTKGSASITIAIDSAASASAAADSKKQTVAAMNASKKHDKGGDVSL
jgi:hypothetical protein